ncbi:MAG: hypothetical protein JSV08_08190 [Acidobacteriota bacterium]|nr:MAG: hypothetical protein JSV08_08190 [Acidobacteriota bacterium]
MKKHASFLHRKKPAMAMLWIAVAAAAWSAAPTEQRKTLEELQEAVAQEPSAPQRHADLGDHLLETNRFEEAAAAYRQASELGGDYTARRGIFYDGKLYLKEVYSGGFMRDRPIETAYLLALDPKEGKVLERHRLPGIAESFVIKNDAVHITYHVSGTKGSEAVIIFSRGAFDRPIWYGGNLLARLNSMRGGQILASNFGGDLKTREYVSGAKFDSRPEEFYDDAPKTLDELEAALREAIERDPTQPWHLFYLGQTLWSQEQGEEAEKIWEAMFTEDYPAIPYYEYAWMANYYERLGQRTWADRSFEEALRRRRRIPQPIEWCTLVERLINIPFVRAAAWASQKGVDPERQHLWIERAREISGVCEADEFAAAAWEKHFRERGETVKAEREAAFFEIARKHPSNTVQSLAHLDYTLSVLLGTKFGVLWCWLGLLGYAVQRRLLEQDLQTQTEKSPWHVLWEAWLGIQSILRKGLNQLPRWAIVSLLNLALVLLVWGVAYLIILKYLRITTLLLMLLVAAILLLFLGFLYHRSVSLHSLISALTSKERVAVLLSALSFLVSVIAFIALEHRIVTSWGTSIGVMDSLGHTAFVQSLEKHLESNNTGSVRYAAAVVNHMAGNVERSIELYEALPDNPHAQANLAALRAGDTVLSKPLTAEALFQAYGSTLRNLQLHDLWKPPKGVIIPFRIEAAVVFIVLLALAAAFLLIPSEAPQTEWRPKTRAQRFYWKGSLLLIPGAYDMERRSPILGWFLVTCFLFCLWSITLTLFAWQANPASTGMFTMFGIPNLLDAFPYPHAIAEGQDWQGVYRWDIFGAWSGAKIFWPVVVLAGVFSLGVHVSRLRRIWNL